LRDLGIALGKENLSVLGIIGALALEGDATGPAAIGDRGPGHHSMVTRVRRHTRSALFDPQKSVIGMEFSQSYDEVDFAIVGRECCTSIRL
jgi:hypothetical protein